MPQILRGAGEVVVVGVSTVSRVIRWICNMRDWHHSREQLAYKKKERSMKSRQLRQILSDGMFGEM